MSICKYNNEKNTNPIIEKPITHCVYVNSEKNGDINEIRSNIVTYMTELDKSILFI